MGRKDFTYSLIVAARRGFLPELLIIPAMDFESTLFIGLAMPLGLDHAILSRGPVNPEGVAVLAEFEDPEEAGIVVLDDVGFVAIEEALEVHAPELQRTRVFAGVAGWGPEQLEDELERDDWIIEPADTDAIFTDEPDRLWSEVLRRKGGRYELVARMPLDPSMN